MWLRDQGEMAPHPSLPKWQLPGKQGLWEQRDRRVTTPLGRQEPTEQVQRQMETCWFVWGPHCRRFLTLLVGSAAALPAQDW